MSSVCNPIHSILGTIKFVSSYFFAFDPHAYVNSISTPRGSWSTHNTQNYGMVPTTTHHYQQQHINTNSMCDWTDIFTSSNNCCIVFEKSTIDQAIQEECYICDHSSSNLEQFHFLFGLESKINEPNYGMYIFICCIHYPAPSPPPPSPPPFPLPQLYSLTACVWRRQRGERWVGVNLLCVF